jgi:peptide methionine sulfoxide reductase msrA/msrB
MPDGKVIHFLENLELFYKGVISMLDWNKVLEFADNGNPAPDRTVRKTDDEWRMVLTDEQFQVTRNQGTERPFSSEMCSLFGPGLYSCICCDTLLFDANQKFESGTGWPSFTSPVKENAIAYHADRSHGMVRIETTCNTCEAHLGHVFPDGPQPSGLRYCMNAVALKKVEGELETATFGGGCFWCTEAMFRELKGVYSVESGYTGGVVDNPAYRDVCGGQTGHAEVIQVLFDPSVISYRELLQIHFGTHDPTTLNQQGADKGTQYRSAIFAHNDLQKETALSVIDDMQQYFSAPITTQVEDLTEFYKAEQYHQDYYRENSDQGYCQVVITPKLKKLRELFADKLV